MATRKHPALPPAPRPPRRPLTEEEKLRQEPWYPPPWELADATAIQALHNGTANADQQRRAMRYIIEVLAGRNEMSYRPGGEEGRRNTDFAEGRRFVGNQLVKLILVNLSAMRRREPNADEHEPG